MPHPSLLLIHLVALGIWLGCILTEAAFEHTLPKDEAFERAVARLHVLVDVWIETPAFVIVLVTGALMFADSPGDTTFQIKVALGLVAVATNVWCVWLVFRRRSLFERGERSAALVVDNLQHKAGGVLLAVILAALAIGATYFVA
jgi:ABC-type Co2+ transport system permease subunit